eukprot:1152185-Pelagomonas_calceolata.AAC.7
MAGCAKALPHQFAWPVCMQAERFVRLHPEQFEELLPPAVVPEALTAAGKGADKEHPPGRVGPPSRWEGCPVFEIKGYEVCDTHRLPQGP